MAQAQPQHAEPASGGSGGRVARLSFGGLVKMLLFIDEPRNLKIVRQEADGQARQVLGKVRKTQLALAEEQLADLTADEVEEAEAVFDLIAEGETARIKASVAAFPSTLREVLVYYRENASPVEQRWILGALLEGLRVVRRHDRETSI